MKNVNVKMESMIFLYWIITKCIFFNKLIVSEFIYNSVPICLIKFFTTMNMVIMARVLYKLTYFSSVFMVLPMTWAEERARSTQVELQQDEVVLAYMFKKRSKFPSIKRLQNTNSFCWWSVSAQLGWIENQFVFC